jgi:hypothetical protein
MCIEKISTEAGKWDDIQEYHYTKSVTCLSYFIFLRNFHKYRLHVSSITGRKTVICFRTSHSLETVNVGRIIYRGADKSLARPGRKQATGTAVFEFHITYL